LLATGREGTWHSCERPETIVLDSKLNEQKISSLVHTGIGKPAYLNVKGSVIIKRHSVDAVVVVTTVTGIGKSEQKDNDDIRVILVIDMIQ
jgi:hypothetical protein